MSDAEVLIQAVRDGDAAIVEKFLDAQPDLASAKNEAGLSAFMAAVYAGRTEIRDLLLARGIVLELHEAAAAGFLVRVKEFVEKDVRLAKSYSPDGFPVFALASVLGHKEVVEYLFAKGADVNAISNNGTGYTALTGAVASGHQEIVAFLLRHGADANHRYQGGYTPLLTAAANGHLEILKMLLEHGADLHARTDDAQTASSLAEKRGHDGVVKFLRSRGAP